MTDGRYGLKEVGIKKNPDPIEVRAIRKEEAIRAAKILGLREKNLYFLDIEDKFLNRYKEYALKEIIKILKELKPSEIFFPQEMENNIDHRVTNTIVKEALKTTRIGAIEYRYAVAWMFPLNLMLHFLNEHMFYNMMSYFLRRNLFYVNISELLPIKIKAIEQYKSQITNYFPKQKRPALKKSILRNSFKNTEVFFI